MNDYSYHTVSSVINAFEKSENFHFNSQFYIIVQSCNRAENVVCSQFSDSSALVISYVRKKNFMLSFSDFCDPRSITLAFTISGAVFADYCNRNNVSQACGHVICPDPTTSIACDGYLCTCVKNSKYCISFSTDIRMITISCSTHLSMKFMIYSMCHKSFYDKKYLGYW